MRAWARCARKNVDFSQIWPKIKSKLCDFWKFPNFRFSQKILKVRYMVYCELGLILDGRSKTEQFSTRFSHVLSKTARFLIGRRKSMLSSLLCSLLLIGSLSLCSHTEHHSFLLSTNNFLKIKQTHQCYVSQTVC